MPGHAQQLQSNPLSDRVDGASAAKMFGKDLKIIQLFLAPYHGETFLSFQQRLIFDRLFKICRKYIGRAGSLREFLFQPPYDLFGQHVFKSLSEDPFFDFLVTVRFLLIFRGKGHGIVEQLSGYQWRYDPDRVTQVHAVQA